MEINLQQKSKNWPLYLGIALPIALILFVAASIYLPRLWTTPPQYDFLYTTGDYYYPNGTSYYTVENGRLVIKDDVRPLPNPTDIKKFTTLNTKLYFYDSARDVSRQISVADAKLLQLDSAQQSADGFTVTNGSYGMDFPFGGGYDYNHYLKKGSYSRKLNIDNTVANYSFRFLGWIKR